MKVNSRLKKYIEDSILVIYDSFDKGHGRKHIEDVIERSFNYYKDIKKEHQLNEDMIYTIACYHDIGMMVDRKYHFKHSKEILLDDLNLKEFFSDEEISIMADAVYSHSTASPLEPSSIYGKIVCDADKDINIDNGLLRAFEFTLKNNKDYLLHEHYEDMHREIVRRFAGSDIGGKNLIKFYISCQDNNEYVSLMRKYAYNKDEFFKKMDSLIKKYNLKWLYFF